jgi:hypothetical protein
MPSRTEHDPEFPFRSRVWVALAVPFVLALLGLSSWASGPALPGRPPFQLDPSTAEPALLEVLPGLGPAKVRAIVTERQKASFASLDDFQGRVKGIGPASAARLQPYLRFQP